MATTLSWRTCSSNASLKNGKFLEFAICTFFPKMASTLLFWNLFSTLIRSSIALQVVLEEHNRETIQLHERNFMRHSPEMIPQAPFIHQFCPLFLHISFVIRTFIPIRPAQYNHSSIMYICPRLRLRVSLLFLPTTLSEASLSFPPTTITSISLISSHYDHE